MNSRNAKSVAGLAVGVGLVSGLFVWQGLGPVWANLERAGPSLLWVLLFALPMQLLAAEAWRRLFVPGRRPRFGISLMASWMGAAVNALLPVASLGGEAVKARVLIVRGYNATETVAATVVCKTTQAVAVLCWAVLGCLLLSGLNIHPGVLQGAVAGAALLTLGIAGFVAVQWIGTAGRVAGRLGRVRASWGRWVPKAELLDQQIRAVYGRPSAWLQSILLRVLSRAVPVLEIVFVTSLMAAPMGWWDAVLLGALVYALRSVSFAIPAGLGVQEGGFVAIGALLGQPPSLMLAVSLAARMREVIPDIPLLVLWQLDEGLRWHTRRSSVDAVDEHR